jgi:site-specific DNA-methyltransferase (adenine-specific)
VDRKEFRKAIEPARNSRRETGKSIGQHVEIQTACPREEAVNSHRDVGKKPKKINQANVGNNKKADRITLVFSTKKPLREAISPFNILRGDVLEVLKQYPDNHFDASFADPPYGLSFMGAEWDHGVPSVEVWKELYRVLKPGAFILMFGGPRTVHRQTVAIEDAGFEIRDCLMWLYGSGFPKSHNIANDIDKKLGHKPRGKAIPTASTHLPSGTYGPDGECLSGNKVEPYVAKEEVSKPWQGHGMALKPAYEPCILAMKPNDKTFANNALVHGVSGLNIDACHIGKRWPANLILHAGTVTEEWARYFYASKVSKREREAGLKRFRKKKHAQSGDALKATKEEKNHADGQHVGTNTVEVIANNHPCLKPIDLCRYLALLLLPPAQEGKTRRLLVPFSGSGSEMIGALLAGWDHVTGIEINSRYIKIARSRIKHWTEKTKAA